MSKSLRFVWLRNKGILLKRGKIVLKFLIALVLCLGTALPSYAQQSDQVIEQSVLFQNHVFLPFVTSQKQVQASADELVAIYSISIDATGAVTVDATYPDTVSSANLSIERPPIPQVLVIPDVTSTDEVSASAITCPWGGTGAQYLSSYWFYNPHPDLDFGIDYKVPKKYREHTICITLALSTSLAATGRKLLMFRYNYDANNYRDLVVIGSSAARRLCQTLTGNPNCANWLLRQQAEVRYRL